MRRCVSSKERRPKSALLRLALGPDRKPFVDILGKAPGRGVYVSPDRAALAEVVSPKGITRAFKGAAIALDAQAVERMLLDTALRLEERILELVTLARRAGKLQIGMEAALEATKDPGAILVVAKDLSERSERALPEGRLRIRVSDKVTLGAKLGREEVGVAAVLPSVFSERLAFEAERFSAISSTSTNTVRRGRVRPRQVVRRKTTDG
jgi:predicted RNA-binding protein YlxR (DUF448 family)